MAQLAIIGSDGGLAEVTRMDDQVGGSQNRQALIRQPPPSSWQVGVGDQRELQLSLPAPSAPARPAFAPGTRIWRRGAGAGAPPRESVIWGSPRAPRWRAPAGRAAAPRLSVRASASIAKGYFRPAA